MEGRRGEGVYEVNDEQRNMAQVKEHSYERMKLSAEELRVLKECNHESFWYRCVPMSLVLIGGTQVMVNKGMLKSNRRYGALFKSLGAALIGYIAGKMSYHGRCRDKILQLENSQLADAIRHRRRGGSMWSDVTDRQEFAGPLSSSHKSNFDVEYDANRTMDHRDETYRPSLDNDAPLLLPSQGGATDTRTSYDELRRVNRAEHEKKKHESVGHPSPAVPPVTTPPPTEPPKPRVKRNQWGDVIED